MLFYLVLFSLLTSLFSLPLSSYGRRANVARSHAAFPSCLAQHLSNWIVQSENQVRSGHSVPIVVGRHASWLSFSLKLFHSLLLQIPSHWLASCAPCGASHLKTMGLKIQIRPRHLDLVMAHDVESGLFLPPLFTIYGATTEQRQGAFAEPMCLPTRLARAGVEGGLRLPGLQLAADTVEKSTRTHRRVRKHRAEMSFCGTTLPGPPPVAGPVVVVFRFASVRSFRGRLSVHVCHNFALSRRRRPSSIFVSWG